MSRKGNKVFSKKITRYVFFFLLLISLLSLLLINDYKLDLNILKLGTAVASGSKITYNSIKFDSNKNIPTPSFSTPGLQSLEIEQKAITKKTHVVQEGETVWEISIKYGLPMQELLSANNLSEETALEKGMVLEIPVYHIPPKPTPGPRYGELLDWWSEAQYLWPIGREATVIDFYTGKRWKVRRTIGGNHADCEPLTAEDTMIMKETWGGEWSWNIRPIIVEVDGRRIAGSASAMPHDIQYITGNGFNGHFDIHFLNSTRHRDGLVNWRHQEDVLIAGGALSPPGGSKDK
ncbi:MAG: LysM peptidoglycan-binding domain-containing protein [Dethiobacteria bacterium]|jgi:LysM repeat protein|nr:LysM peptidoglycan-binding domain-containing protein [Bacillota bacterium]